MMTEERRAADRKIKQENLFKSLGAGEQEAETEGFQCSRCKQASHPLLYTLAAINIHSSASVGTVKHRHAAPMNP